MQEDLQQWMVSLADFPYPQGLLNLQEELNYA